MILWRLTYVALPGDGVDRRARRHIALKVDVIPFLYAVGVQLAAQTQVQNGRIWKKILSLRMIYPTNLDKILLSGSNHSQKLKRKMYVSCVLALVLAVQGLAILPGRIEAGISNRGTIFLHQLVQSPDSFGL